MIHIDLKGKNALITGGTRGIGRVISRRLAEAGASTLAVYQSDGASALESINERKSYGSDSHANVQVDLSSESDVEWLVQHSRNYFGGALDYLVLNAAIGLHGKVSDIEPAMWRRMFDINLSSAFLLCRGLSPSMRRGGSIVAISSGSGQEPIPGLAFYGASKAALNMFVADFAQEVGPRGIRCNSVSPGSTDSKNYSDAPAPEAVQDSATSNALRRRGVPDDVAKVVLFLCSDLSSFVTGQAIRVNGGAI